MERPVKLQRERVKRVFAYIADEIVAQAYLEGYYLPGKDSLYSQPFLALNIEGVGRRWGQKSWRKAALGDTEAKKRIVRYQRKVQAFYKTME